MGAALSIGRCSQRELDTVFIITFIRDFVCSVLLDDPILSSALGSLSIYTTPLPSLL